MTIFKSQKVIDLEARVSELEAENLDLKGQIETAKHTAETDQAAALSDANEKIKELTSVNEEIPSLNAQITALSAQIETLTAENVVTKEKIDAAAAEKLAAMGHGEPINLGSSAITTPENKTKTRAELSSMKPSEVKSFISKGGKFID